MMEQYLDARCVTFDLQADTKDDAIRELAHLLTEAGYVNDEEAYAEAVLYRETIDTTAWYEVQAPRPDARLAGVRCE